MKRTPEQKNLEDVLRSPRFIAHDFMGHDIRPYEDIIRDDTAVISKMGRSIGEIATRMWEITDRARQGLETYVDIDEKLEARVIDTRGKIPCPWPHPGRYAKRVVEMRRKDTGRELRWTELNIHLIEAHSFFEGHGALFRVDPRALIEIIF